MKDQFRSRLAVMPVVAAGIFLLCAMQAAQATLVSRWTFNDPTQTSVVSDVGGGGNDLTIFGSPTYVSTPGAGNYGLLLNSSAPFEDHLRVDHDGTSWNLDVTNGFSLVAFIQILDIKNSTEAPIMQKYGDGNYSMVYVSNSVNKQNGSINNGISGVSLVGPGSLPTSFLQLAYTWDATTGDLRLYTNGVLTATAASSILSLPAGSAGTHAFVIGTGFFNSLNGVFDELQVYNTALSATELAALQAEAEILVPEPSTVALMGVGLLFLIRRTISRGRH